MSDAFLFLRVLYPNAGLPQGVTGPLRPIGARPSPPPCGWSLGFITEPRTVGLIPICLFLPALPIANIPVGTTVHNVELKPGKGGELARSAGSSVQILGREGNYVLVRLTSGEVRKVLGTCLATVGEVGNEDYGLVKLGKAGRKRHMGIRPTVRGSVMNPNDHPHGGGEGKAPVGRSGPMTPWGKPALGYKTRKKKASDKLIVRRRNGK